LVRFESAGADFESVSSNSHSPLQVPVIPGQFGDMKKILQEKTTIISQNF
jgi:hypothetical protein